MARVNRCTQPRLVPAKTSVGSCQPNSTPPRVGVCHNSPPPSGEYTIEVNGFSVGEGAGADCGGGDYELTIRVEGQPDRVETGTVADDETATFSVSR